MTDKPVSPLRQRMIEDMTVRHFKEKGPEGLHSSRHELQGFSRPLPRHRDQRGSSPFSIIPRSRQYPKILWIDDAEVVGDGITKASPVLGDFVAQEIERGVRELSACGVAFVVRYIPVHETP